jgi:hypothetical protein
VPMSASRRLAEAQSLSHALPERNCLPSYCQVA